MDQLLDFIRDHGFNAIRLPISLELALDLDKHPPGGITDRSLLGLTSVSICD